MLKEAERSLVRLMQEHGSVLQLCRLLTITLNNLACYHKKKGMFRSALRYLSQILSIEKFCLKEKQGLSSTYLNISTILGHLSKHQEALKFAKTALQLANEEVSRSGLQAVQTVSQRQLTFEDQQSDSDHLNKDSNQTSNSKLKQEKPDSNE